MLNITWSKSNIRAFLLFALLACSPSCAFLQDGSTIKKSDEIFQKVITCFAQRLGLEIYSQWAIIDGIIEDCGQPKDYATRTMVLGVITSISKQYEEHKGLFGMPDINAIADEITSALNSIFQAKRWSVQNKSMLMIGGAAITTLVMLYLAWSHFKQKEYMSTCEEKITALKNEVAYYKHVEGLREAIKEVNQGNFQIDVRRDLGQIKDGAHKLALQMKRKNDIETFKAVTSFLAQSKDSD